MTFQSYAVTRGCNSETQQRRGKLGGYAVTRYLYTCACVRRQAGACVCVCVHVPACGCNRVTVQLARRAAGFVVTRARNRVTHSLLLQKKKGNRMGQPLSQQPEGAQAPDSGAVAGVQARRQAMPEVAAFVDLCRAAYAEFVDVDAAMATAQQARREHAQVLAEQGADAAARWLKRNANRCTFHAEEAGRSVGLASPWTGATPPIGTPPAQTRGGNSAPARAPVAGRGKSERVGEQPGRSLPAGPRSPAAVAPAGGVHRG